MEFVEESAVWRLALYAMITLKWGCAAPLAEKWKRVKSSAPEDRESFRQVTQVMGPILDRDADPNNGRLVVAGKVLLEDLDEGCLFRYDESG